MIFTSILFGTTEKPPDTLSEPDFFHDLNLDQIVAAITSTKADYNLTPFFYAPLRDVNTVLFRQEVMRDLENQEVYEMIVTFARLMNEMRHELELSQKSYYERQRDRWFLNAALSYCKAVDGLARALKSVPLQSHGLSSFRDFISAYTSSGPFAALAAETKALYDDLSAIRFCLTIKGLRIDVSQYESQDDYSTEIEKAFLKFRQGEVKDRDVDFKDDPEHLSHVIALIIDKVAGLHPEVFERLSSFRASRTDFIDRSIKEFEREIQFYVAFIEYMVPLRKVGLVFCYPHVGFLKTIEVKDAFDAALASKCAAEGASVVRNDFSLRGRERIIVVTGPNQGGKTTFARMVGQLHYLAALGCPVPARRARLFLFDRLFTHFEREESLEMLRGKLQDDLERIRAILGQATPNSLIILNEIFSSTTAADSAALGVRVMRKIIALDALCVCVTFIDELASLGKSTVSMMSTVVAGNPSQRTFKIVRAPADGLAYALSIAEKYGLTSAALKERIKS